MEYNEVTIDKNHVEVMIHDLCFKIRHSKQKFTKVVGIARGGLHISKPLAYSLNLPHYIIRISFYNGRVRGDVPKEVDMRGLEFTSKDHILLVDDLVDRGKTIDYFKANFDVKHKVAVLFWNPKGVKPDYYIEKKKDNDWLVFPWED